MSLTLYVAFFTSLLSTDESESEEDEEDEEDEDDELGLECFFWLAGGVTGRISKSESAPSAET